MSSQHLTSFFLKKTFLSLKQIYPAHLLVFHGFLMKFCRRSSIRPLWSGEIGQFSWWHVAFLLSVAIRKKWTWCSLNLLKYVILFHNVRYFALWVVEREVKRLRRSVVRYVCLLKVNWVIIKIKKKKVKRVSRLLTLSL